MIEEVQKLIDLVYHEQQSKREAELKTLQEQIKPHFLYNTLDTIQWMAQEHGAQDIVEVVGALTSLFRIGLSRGKEMIRVSDELEHVRSYLIIQKARYEDKFDFTLSADEEVLSCMVLKLTLQPLVENAIYHGIKERRGHGSIQVEARRRDGMLVMRVSDDGVGMSPAKLAEVRALARGLRPARGRARRLRHSQRARADPALLRHALRAALRKRAGPRHHRGDPPSAASAAGGVKRCGKC